MCATPLVGRLLQQISASPFLELQPGDRVAVLVNNLGTTTPMEMGIVAGAALAELRGPVHQVGNDGKSMLCVCVSDQTIAILHYQGSVVCKLYATRALSFHRSTS